MQKNSDFNWKKLDRYVKASLKNDTTGHDYKHTKRVLKNCLLLVGKQPVDREVLIASALLHDISYKNGYIKNHHLVGAKMAPKILAKMGFPAGKIKKVVLAIEDHVGNFMEPVRKNSQLQVESTILRDADNLDALGEIGVQRQKQFSKMQKVPNFISKDDKVNESLYGSLKFMLAWPDKMLTKQGRRLGRERLQPIKDYMQKILAQSDENPARHD